MDYHGLPARKAPVAHIDTLEPRRLLAATPVAIPNFLGDFVGFLQDSAGASQPITVSITTQKKRVFSGTFAEGDGTTATFKGAVAKKGLSKFTYKSTNANPKFTGVANFGLNQLGDTITGVFSTRTGKVKTTQTFLAIKQ